MQEGRKSSALGMELRVSCINPSIWNNAKLDCATRSVERGIDREMWQIIIFEENTNWYSHI